jgi:hypothetical protein
MEGCHHLGTRDWYLMHYSNLVITRGQKHTHTYKTFCPPAAQQLYTLGLENETTSTTCPPPRPVNVAKYPSIPLTTVQFPSTVSAPMTHLPLHLSQEPPQSLPAVKTAKRTKFIDQLRNTPRNDTNISQLYGITSDNVAQVYMSPSPYNDAFKEELNLRHFNFTQHQATGMSLIQQSNQLILASIVPSTPGAKVPRWRTRIHRAWLISINNTPVQALPEVLNIFRRLYEENTTTWVLLFSHPMIQRALTNKGISLL